MSQTRCIIICVAGMLASWQSAVVLALQAFSKLPVHAKVSVERARRVVATGKDGGAIGNCC